MGSVLPRFSRSMKYIVSGVRCVIVIRVNEVSSTGNFFKLIARPRCSQHEGSITIVGLERK